MKKLGITIAFFSLFAIGLSAQTPKPTGSVKTKPQAVGTTTQATTAQPKSPAKNTVVRKGGKHKPVKAATTTKPVDGATIPKQKTQ